MHHVLYDPFDSPGVVSINPRPTRFTDSPVYRLFTLLVQEIQGPGIKATAKGNLGRNACRRIAEQYFSPEEYREMTEFGHINTEEDFRELSVLRFIASDRGFVRKYKGKFTLSRACRALLSDGGEAGIYLELLRTYCENFNWAYGDGCYENQFFQRSFMFTLYLLWKFGGLRRNTDFYGERFIRAFPRLRQDLEEGSRPFEKDRVDYYIMLCLRLRVIERFAGFFGLVEAERTGKKYTDEKHFVKKAPLLDEMFRFSDRLSRHAGA